MTFQCQRATCSYRSVGLMLDRDDTEVMVTLSLWWVDLSWTWGRA